MIGRMVATDRKRPPGTQFQRLAVLVTLAVGLFAFGRSVGNALSTPSASCGARPSTAIASKEIGDFDVIMEGPLTVLPMKGQRQGSSPLPVATDFRDGYSRGFISRRALTPEARRLEARHDGPLGYSPGPFPIVPLVGPVVSENPGLLELYQTTTVFRTTESAAAWLDIRSGQLTGELRTSDSGVEPAVGARVFRYSLGPSDPENEVVLRLLVREGMIDTDISLQSSGEVPMALASTIVGPSIARLMECSRHDVANASEVRS